MLAAVGLTGCVAAAEGFIDRVQKDPPDAGRAPSPMFLDGAVRHPSVPLPDAAPHTVLGIEPARGPFRGGQRAIVRGRGFDAGTRVWIGSAEASNVTVVDARRIQLAVPPGVPGTADVRVQNGTDVSTRRTLAAGYAYEAFYVTPSSGPTSGGTVITITTYGLDVGPDTRVTIDLEPCEYLEHRDLGDEVSELDCTAPPGTPGAKLVRVSSGGETTDVLDGFVYGGDSTDGLAGGLSGAALDGHLRVRVRDEFSGSPLEGATVILGVDVAPDSMQATDAEGWAAFEDIAARRPMVTVAARCKMPMSFVEVPVDSLTVYLRAEQSPECRSEGDPVLVGGARRASATVKGEIYWPAAREFRRGPWRNVPVPTRDEAELTAYVFPLQSSPSRSFRLPSASDRITPMSDGTLGYEFELDAGVGNLTLYALAGIEDRSTSPPRFTAYTFGFVRGVSTAPGETTEEVFVPMDFPLERALTLDVDGPRPTPRGPDRLQTSAAVGIGDLGYAIFPVSEQTLLLPATGPVSFTGLPALVGALSESTYVLTAAAQTGASGTEPRSVLDTFATNSADERLSLSGFVEIPSLAEPAPNTEWAGTRLAVNSAAGGPIADLSIVEVITGGERSTWTIVAPGEASDLRLPDLSRLPELGPRPGPAVVQVTRARIRDFDYAALRTAQLRRQAFSAYATDLYNVNYQPQ